MRSGHLGVAPGVKGLSFRQFCDASFMAGMLLLEEPLVPPGARQQPLGVFHLAFQMAKV